jgi:hypothetical protein
MQFPYSRKWADEKTPAKRPDKHITDDTQADASLALNTGARRFRDAE